MVADARFPGTNLDLLSAPLNHFTLSKDNIYSANYLLRYSNTWGQVCFLSGSDSGLTQQNN